MSLIERAEGEPIRISIEVAALIPSVAILFCEGLVYLGYIDLALGAYVLTLMLCLAGSFYGNDASIFNGFILIPVFRLVNLGMPLIAEVSLLWIPLIYGPLIPSGLIMAWSNPSVRLRMGWLAGFGALPVVVALGVLLGAAEFEILRPVPLITGPEHYLVLGVIMIGFVGFVEELLFRGILQPALQTNLGPFRGIVLASLIFGMMHAGVASAPDIGFGFVMGLVLGFLYARYGSLLMITVIHGLLNVFLFGFYPLEGSFVELEPIGILVTGFV